jgi:AcrR family transcriptional regulator
MAETVPFETPQAPRGRAFVKGKATRRAIMQAAQTVFAREGFMNAEISHITEAAGKAKGTFYLYFDSKTDLLAAMVQAFAEDLRAPDKLAEPTHPPEQIRRVITTIWTTFRQHAPTFRALAEAATKHPEFAEINRNLRSYAVRDFTTMIRSRQEAGFCRHLDAELGAAALESMLANCIYEWMAIKDGILDGPLDEARALNALVTIMQLAMELPPDGSSV